MTTTIEQPMKGEDSLLTLLCLGAAALFLALVAYNLFAAGAIISTDGLFFTVVPLLLALCFLAFPASQLIKGRLEKRALKRGDEPVQMGATAAQVQGAPRVAPALKDPKGRALPPDVNRMVAEMNKGRSTTE